MLGVPSSSTICQALQNIGQLRDVRNGLFFNLYRDARPSVV
jgi:hypothetical protein